MSVLWTRENRKVLLSMHILWTRVNKKVHISVNTSDVKDSMNETKNEEPLVTDNSVINALIYFKLFECSEKY